VFDGSGRPSLDPRTRRSLDQALTANYRTRDGRITFQIQGEDQKSIFRGISQLQDVFEADSTCGLCQSQNIRFSVRNHEDNEYFELLCQECSAKLEFGQHKKGGTLFPKRRNDDGILPNRGWRKWQSPNPQRADGLAAGPRAVSR
jgi:hypothetical protein